MNKTILMDKYPVFSHEIAKSETNFKSVDSIIKYLKDLVEKHPVAEYIAIFDHYQHTKELDEGVISEDILDAKNLIFCFGKQLPNPQILAVRPRSIGVSELKDSFSINFMEAPNEQLQKVVKTWVESLSNN